MMKTPNVGIEVEFIIVDKNNKPINEIEKKTAFDLVKTLILEQYPDLDPHIQPELDACQIEIISNPGKPDEVKSEILDIAKIVKNTVEKNLGLKIIGGVPNQNFEPIHYPTEKYEKIHDLLMRVGLPYRKATNIAGIHLHIEENENFSRFIHLSKKVREAILNGNLEKILMSAERLDQYKKVIEALRKLEILDTSNPFTSSHIPYIFRKPKDVKNLVFTPNGEIRKNYNLVGIKKPGDNLTTEIRTADSTGNIDELRERIEKYINFGLE